MASIRVNSVLLYTFYRYFLYLYNSNLFNTYEFDFSEYNCSSICSKVFGISEDIWCYFWICFIHFIYTRHQAYYAVYLFIFNVLCRGNIPLSSRWCGIEHHSMSICSTLLTKSFTTNVPIPHYNIRNINQVGNTIQTGKISNRNPFHRRVDTTNTSLIFSIYPTHTVPHNCNRYLYDLKTTVSAIQNQIQFQVVITRKRAC